VFEIFGVSVVKKYLVTDPTQSTCDRQRVDLIGQRRPYLMRQGCVTFKLLRHEDFFFREKKHLDDQR